MSTPIVITRTSDNAPDDGIQNGFFELSSGVYLGLNGSYNSFIVDNGATLNLTGAGNTVLLQNHAGVNGYVGTFTGDGNTISGAGCALDIVGQANTVNLGDNSSFGDYAANYNSIKDPAAALQTGNSMSAGVGSVITARECNDVVTVGANSTVWDLAENVTINGLQGGDTINESTVRGFRMAINATINAVNDTLNLEQGNTTVNGTGNQIYLNSQGETDLGVPVALNLNGGNNTISYSANSDSGKQVLIQDSDGDYVQEDASGAISFSSCHFSLVNGLATLTFADGNSVKISGVLSSTQDTTLTGSSQVGQVNQLVSAMASYSPGSGGASSTLTAQAPVETALFASAHH